MERVHANNQQASSSPLQNLRCGKRFFLIYIVIPSLSLLEPSEEGMAVLWGLKLRLTVYTDVTSGKVGRPQMASLWAPLPTLLLQVNPLVNSRDQTWVVGLSSLAACRIIQTNQSLPPVGTRGTPSCYSGASLSQPLHIRSAPKAQPVGPSSHSGEYTWPVSRCQSVCPVSPLITFFLSMVSLWSSIVHHFAPLFFL